MKFLPIEADNRLNARFHNHPECAVILQVFVEHYKKAGFQKPWIAYFISNDKDEIIGGGGFKGQPKEGKVEITYGTFKDFEGQGIGTQICRQLVGLALHTDQSVQISARTFPDNLASIKILKNNGFECVGTVYDDEDGNVLEWVYKNATPDQRA